MIDYNVDIQGDYALTGIFFLKDTADVFLVVMTFYVNDIKAEFNLTTNALSMEVS